MTAIVKIGCDAPMESGTCGASVGVPAETVTDARRKLPDMWPGWVSLDSGRDLCGWHSGRGGR